MDKQREPRDCQLLEKAATRRWEDSGYVFTGKSGSPLNPATLPRAFRWIVDRSELPRIRLYDLRHTHAHRPPRDIRPTLELGPRSSHISTSSGTGLTPLSTTFPTEQATATQWLDDPGRHLEAATKIAELDPSGAYVLAYDAARKSVAGALLMSGHRVLSRPESHQALAQYAGALAMQVDEPGFNRFDRLRRNRSRSEYGSRTFGKAEVKEAIDTAGATSGACASLI